MPEGGHEGGTGADLEAGRAARSTAGAAVGTGAGNATAATGMGVRTVPAGAGAGAGIIPARETDTSRGHGAGQERPRGPRSVAGLGLSAPHPLCPRSRGSRGHPRRQVKLLVSAVVRQLQGKPPLISDTCAVSCYFLFLFFQINNSCLSDVSHFDRTKTILMK